MKIARFLNLENIKRHLTNGVKIIPKLPIIFYHFLAFFVLLVIFLFGKMGLFLERLPLVGRFYKILDDIIRSRTKKLTQAITNRIEGSRTSEMKRSYLINLAFRSLMLKKTRSFITIAGMSVGIGIIVLLLSLGYGLEKLIISRVASLDELKVADITSGETTSTRLSREVYQKIAKIKNIASVLPIASVVGRISYNRATTDVVVYAVPRSYLDLIKVKLKSGKLFSKAESYNDELIGKIAGVSTSVGLGKLGERISTDERIYFNILPDTRASVWSECSIASKLIGYTTRIEGGYLGKDYWGEDYSPFSPYGRSAYDQNRKISLGQWIKAKVPLFEESVDGSLRPSLDDQGRHRWEESCLQMKYIQVTDKFSLAEVLGEQTTASESAQATTSEATDSASLSVSTTEETATESASIYDDYVVSTNEAGIEFVSLQSASDSAKKKDQESLTFQQAPSRKAVVSLGMINLLGINPKKAIGTTFKSSFILTKSLLPDVSGKALTKEEEYMIIGVVDDPEDQYFYIPLADLQKVGLKFFSQLKIVLSSKEKLTDVRKAIQTMGFKAVSTQDTVAQIESLFANLRLILGLLGMVALGVAALGMFNTLTVSLLERTREIGGMKTMGMVSGEVQDLFLAEAMIMGLSGGIGGLFIGFLSGEVISFLISLWSMSNGQGYLKLTHIPSTLVFFILISSFIVGLVTGIYPAQRAKSISALNALRYE